MSLSIITQTRFTNIAWLERCKESVAAALPEGAVHHIIPSYTHWAETRLEAALSNEFVAFVDDDDTIDPRSLSLCLKAIKESGVGIAVTTEVAVNPDQSIKGVYTESKSYQLARIKPRNIHHLTLFRSSAVDPTALKIHNEFGIGIDWFMTCSAALEYKAIHVPINGYFWTIHQNSESFRTNQIYSRNIKKMSKRINETWTNRAGLIPIYQLGV